MNPVHHSLCTHVIPPAPGDEGKVNPLAVRIDDSGFTSYWRPNATDLEILRAGGSIAMNTASARLVPARIYVVDPQGGTPQILSDADCALEFANHIAELCAGEGESVTLHSNNADFNGLPNCFITCMGDWTAWNDREFRNDNLLECTRAAAMERKTWEAVNPNGLASPDKSRQPDSPAKIKMMLASEIHDRVAMLRSCNPGIERLHLDEAVLFGINHLFEEAIGAPARRFTQAEADRLIEGIRKRATLPDPQS